MSQLTAAMAPDPVSETSVPDFASVHMHPAPEPEPATALAATFRELLWVIIDMKNVGFGWTTIASTNPLSPAYGPFVGGTLIVTVADLVPLVIPFAVVAACPANFADEVELLYL